MASAVKDSLATTKLPELSLPQRNAGSPSLFFCGNENDAQTNELDVAGSGIILRLEATVAAFTATEPVSGTPREAEQAMALRFFAKCSFGPHDHGNARRRRDRARRPGVRFLLAGQPEAREDGQQATREGRPPVAARSGLTAMLQTVKEALRSACRLLGLPRGLGRPGNGARAVWAEGRGCNGVGSRG